MWNNSFQDSEGIRLQRVMTPTRDRKQNGVSPATALPHGLERVQAVVWGMGRKAEAGKQLKDQTESWETGLSSVPSSEHPRGEKAPERELLRPLERLAERRAGPASTWGNSVRPGKERPGGERDSPGHMRGHGAGKSAVPASQTAQLAFTMRNAKPFTLHAPVPWSKSGKQDTQKKLVI